MKKEHKNANPKEGIESIVVHKPGMPRHDKKKTMKQWFVCKVLNPF